MSQAQKTELDRSDDKSGARKEALEELRSDFAQLREDLKQLRHDITGLGASSASELKDVIRSGVAKAEGKAQEAVEFASSELSEIQKQAQRAIRKNPLSAISAALAIGYFLSSATRR